MFTLADRTFTNLDNLWKIDWHRSKSCKLKILHVNKLREILLCTLQLITCANFVRHSAVISYVGHGLCGWQWTRFMISAGMIVLTFLTATVSENWCKIWTIYSVWRQMRYQYVVKKIPKVACKQLWKYDPLNECGLPLSFELFMKWKAFIECGDIMCWLYFVTGCCDCCL